MGLTDAAKMRKSAAVVGEVIGKYHPHGDQAAYDAMVRMAQDFSLRYPLVAGSGNFGSVDGDSPAAMRYTETRLSAFAGALLREINQGTTEFQPTYDGMGEEPLVLPALLPNLLLNGSSGIAVGMSCSFAPHNLIEVIDACREAIKQPHISTPQLLRFVKGPDFPTGGEIIDGPDALAEIYTTGHGSVRLRGTYHVEEKRRNAINLIVDSIPYSVNKSRLIERIASLIRDKKLRFAHDVRDESAQDIRIVIELKGPDPKPDAVMAYLYRHTDLQINFPINMIAITPQGVPERLGLAAIIRHFLDFRFEKTTLRLQHRLEHLRVRIHLLEGFEKLFRDIDKAIAIIRGAKRRSEAEAGLMSAFDLDKEQADAILEMRLYKLVSLEIDKLLDELDAKRKELLRITHDLASPERLWKIVDKDLADAKPAFGDERRTKFVTETSAPALDYNPEEFVDHEDVTVILSKQGWLRRVKMAVEDPSSLKFREGDGLLAMARVNTGKTIALFSNMGRVYILRVIDTPQSSGFGEPVGSLLSIADGEIMVGLIAPDPAPLAAPADEEVGLFDDPEPQGDSESGAAAEPDPEPAQPPLFLEIGNSSREESAARSALSTSGSRPLNGEGDRVRMTALVATRMGKGFQIPYDALGDPTKRNGKKLANLFRGDEVISVTPVTAPLTVAATDEGRCLAFGTWEIPTMTGPAQGVRMMSHHPDVRALFVETMDVTERLRVTFTDGTSKTFRVAELGVRARGGRGIALGAPVARVEKIQPETVEDMDS
jgi:DNA gyrase subunit A